MPKLSDFTVAHIHNAVRNTHTLWAAAQALELKDACVLTSYLGKFLIYGEPLSLDTLRALSVADAHKLWGAEYTQNIASPKINIHQYQASHIHYLSHKADTVRHLASLLGVRDHAVRRYLKHFAFYGAPLTFEQLKTLSNEQALEVFNEKYHMPYPPQRINLTPHIPEKHMQLPAKPMLKTDDFDVLAAKFKHQFPKDTFSGQKRNRLTLFSGVLSTKHTEETSPNKAQKPTISAAI